MLSKALLLILLAALALFLVAGLPTATAQSTPTIEVYPLPPGATSIDAMTIDSSGNIWMAQSTPAMLYEYSVSSNVFQSHVIPTNAQAMIRGISAYGNSFIWIADAGGNQVVGYDVAKNKFYNFTFPLQLDVSSVISDGTYLWVGCNMELGQVGIYTSNMTDHYIDNYNADIAALAMDRQGNIWFVESNSGKVGGYYSATGQVRIFPIPTANSDPTCLAVDSQGRMWFVESAVNQLGMFDTNQNSFQEIPLPVIDGKQVIAKQLTVDSDNNVWITDLPNNRVIKYYPQKNVFVPIALNGSKVYPNFIVNNNDKIWFSEGGNISLASLQVDPLYGLTATPTPVPTVQPTAVPTNRATATPAPTRTPGFGIVAALIAIVIIAKRVSR